MNAPAEVLASLSLKDRKLLRQQCYIDGAWVDADSGKTLAVHNPATGEELGTVPRMAGAEAKRAIEAAERAWPAWRAKTAKERAACLRKWFDLMMANQEDLAQIMTAEQGKPLTESRGEIAYGASFIEWFAEEGKRAYGDTIPSPRSASAPASRRACSTSSPATPGRSAASCAPIRSCASSRSPALPRPGECSCASAPTRSRSSRSSSAATRRSSSSTTPISTRPSTARSPPNTATP